MTLKCFKIHMILERGQCKGDKTSNWGRTGSVFDFPVQSNLARAKLADQVHP
jgi:hypothetical protein